MPSCFQYGRSPEPPAVAAPWLCCSPLDLLPLPAGSPGSSLAWMRSLVNFASSRAARTGPRRFPRSYLRLHHLPLVRFARSVCTPPPTKPARVHSQRRKRHLRPADATRLVAFRPCGFSPLRRLSPRAGARACCIPEPEGVRSVSTPRRPLTSTQPESRTPMSGAPRDSRYALHTPRRSPPDCSRRRVSTLRCPLAVGPSPCPPTNRCAPRRPSTSRRCSAARSVATSRRFQ